MLFRFTRPSDGLLRALRTAVAMHRPTDLRTLLACHGEPAFARALAGLSGRVIADALSMLSAADRMAVRRHLSRAALLRLQEIEHRHATDSARTQPTARWASLLLPRP
ncbi:MAG: hypothetical protein RBR29_11765 [Castellaniella sp.]|uniref:hypothetical protein n=1 Tax=Castellaniella sp. TaxID=1955812 RepID=UPI002A3722B6|nr:hypothetical protein [Castellaniella sp.]MDY0310447.1 hypothetical protein [Castellaniella sp.]